jgi:AsmA protein
MSKPLKIVAIVLGGIVALLVVAAVAISLLFDPNDYKDTITSQVQARTGRTLTLGGDLGLSFFPWLGVETANATLGNAPGFGDQPFATLEHVKVNVRLMPLLDRRIESGNVVIDGLRVNLARNSAGVGNWEDLLAAKTETPPPKSEGPAISGVAIEGLTLRDSSISWRDDRSKANYVVDHISLETGELAPGKPIDLVLALTLASGLPWATDLELSGTVQSDLEKSRYDIDPLKLDYVLRDASQAEVGKGSLTGKLSADTAQSIYSFDGGKLDGTVPFAAAAPPPAKNANGGKPAKADKNATPASGPQSIDIDAAWTTARIEQQTQTLAVTGLTLKALDTTATVTKLDGTQIIDAPQVRGVLDVPQVDVPALMTALGIAPPAGVDAKTLGKGSMHADFDVQPSAGTFAVSGLKAQILGMNLQGDARSEEGQLRGSVRVPQFATAQLFTVIASMLPTDINVKAIDKLALATSFQMDTNKGTLALQDVKADLLDTTLLANVQGSGLNGQPRYTGTMRVDKLDPARFMAVFGTLVPAGITANELGDLALDTRFDSQSSKQLLQLDDLHMTIIGLRFGGNITLSKFPDATEYNGELSVAQFSPRALMKRFGAEPPVTADPKVLTSAVLKSRVSATATSGRFDDFDLTLDQSRLTGRFAVDNFDNPGYDFALAIDKVDVDRYLPPPTPEDATVKKNAKTGDVVIPVAMLKKLRLSGKITAGAMTLGGLQMAQVNATLSAKDGVARLDPLTADLYGGTFAGGFSADARPAPPKIDVKGKATDIGIGRFLQDLSPGEDPIITGKGSFDLQLAGTGNSYKKNLRSSDGSIGFTLKDGALNGFDLGYTLCSAYNVIAQQPKPKAKDTKKTKFESISGTSVVKNGVSSTNDLLGTTTFMKVTGKGSLNLPKETLDYDMDATMTAGTKLQGCGQMDKLIGQSFPLDIGGTISEPKVTPDFGELAKSVLKKQLENKLEDQLKDKLLDKLGGKKPPPKKNP